MTTTAALKSSSASAPTPPRSRTAPPPVVRARARDQYSRTQPIRRSGYSTHGPVPKSLLLVASVSFLRGIAPPAAAQAAGAAAVHRRPATRALRRVAIAPGRPVPAASLAPRLAAPLPAQPADEQDHQQDLGEADPEGGAPELGQRCHVPADCISQHDSVLDLAVSLVVFVPTHPPYPRPPKWVSFGVQASPYIEGIGPKALDGKAHPGPEERVDQICRALSPTLTRTASWSVGRQCRSNRRRAHASHPGWSIARP